MSWKWWILTALLEIFWFSSAFADKKEKEWPPMPSLDSLVGDTTGAITIKDSALIPTFGIYPVIGWGKTIYIDANTFKKNGYVVFFDPWDKNSRNYVEILSELKDKFESEWNFQIFFVACRMSVASCQKYLSKNKQPGWDTRIFLMPDFKSGRNSGDSLKKVLAGIKLDYPVYRLKQPLCFNEPIGELFSTLATLTAKQSYAVYVETAPEKILGYTDHPLAKTGFKLIFPFIIRGLEEDWKFISSKGGDKK